MVDVPFGLDAPQNPQGRVQVFMVWVVSVQFGQGGKVLGLDLDGRKEGGEEEDPPFLVLSGRYDILDPEPFGTSGPWTVGAGGW